MCWKCLLFIWLLNTIRNAHAWKSGPRISIKLYNVVPLDNIVERLHPNFVTGSKLKRNDRCCLIEPETWTSICSHFGHPIYHQTGFNPFSEGTHLCDSKQVIAIHWNSENASYRIVTRPFVDENRVVYDWMVVTKVITMCFKLDSKHNRLAIINRTDCSLFCN